MKVKICGITSLEDALAACEAGADILGFNFAQEARRRNRYIEPGKAIQIIEKLPPFISTAAITVNPSMHILKQLLKWLNYVQIHADDTVDYSGLPAYRIIKVHQLGPDFSQEFLFSCPAAIYLLDAWAPKMSGGTGKTCDWEMARQIVGKGHPIMLAGGLTPDNVAEAIRVVRPYAVDVAGGVESTPGKKDYDKLIAFVRNAKST